MVYVLLQAVIHWLVKIVGALQVDLFVFAEDTGSYRNDCLRQMSPILCCVYTSVGAVYSVLNRPVNDSISKNWCIGDFNEHPMVRIRLNPNPL